MQDVGTNANYILCKRSVDSVAFPKGNGLSHSPSKAFRAARAMWRDVQMAVKGRGKSHLHTMVRRPETLSAMIPSGDTTVWIGLCNIKAFSASPIFGHPIACSGISVASGTMT